MHDDPSADAAKITTELFSTGFKGDTFMKWPACSPDSNHIENIWSILKWEIFQNGKLYTSKETLWEAMQDSARTFRSSTAKTLIASTDNRIFEVINQNDSYTKH